MVFTPGVVHLDTGAPASQAQSGGHGHRRQGLRGRAGDPRSRRALGSIASRRLAHPPGARRRLHGGARGAAGRDRRWRRRHERADRLAVLGSVGWRGGLPGGRDLEGSALSGRRRDRAPAAIPASGRSRVEAYVEGAAKTVRHSGSPRPMPTRSCCRAAWRRRDDPGRVSESCSAARSRSRRARRIRGPGQAGRPGRGHPRRRTRGGGHRALVERMRLRNATGTVLDHLYVVPRAQRAGGSGSPPWLNAQAGARRRRVHPRDGAIRRAGRLRVVAIDAFGDLDLRAVAEVIALRRDGGHPVHRTARGSGRTPGGCVAAAYTSNFENSSDAVALLGAGRRLLGNTPSVLEQIRNPITFMRALRGRGFAVPATQSRAPLRARSPAAGCQAAPLRRRSRHGRLAAGAGCRAPPISSRDRRAFRGRSSSLADGRHAVPLGLSRQLVGRRSLRRPRVPLLRQPAGRAGTALFDRAAEVAATAPRARGGGDREFGLVGLNGIDFIARDGDSLPDRGQPPVLRVDGAGGTSLGIRALRFARARLSR